MLLEIENIIKKLGEPIGKGRQAEYHQVDDDTGMKLYFTTYLHRKDYSQSPEYQSIYEYFHRLRDAEKCPFVPNAYGVGMVTIPRTNRFMNRCLMNRGRLFFEKHAKNFDDFPHVTTGFILMEHIKNAIPLRNFLKNEKECNKIKNELVRKLEEEYGVKHRDPRVENVLVQEIDGDAKYWLIDL